MKSPDEVLRGYMSEMNSWEMRCAKRLVECMSGSMAFDSAKRIGMDEYMAIFDQFCSRSRAVPREYFFTEPPDYNLDGERIETIKTISPREVEIYTQQEYSHRKRHVYSLCIDSNEWRLAEKKVLCEDGELLEAIL